MTLCRFSRWRISAILDFRGPCMTSCRSSIETMALNCLVFEKIAFLYFGDRQTNKQTDRQTDEQMDRPVAWIHSCCRERRLNKCIGDDTKAAECQNPKCILKKQKNMSKTILNMADGIITPCNVARSWRWFRQVTAPCNVACTSGIMTLNSPGGSTLQCGRWLWDDMPWNSPKCLPYWISTSGFDFDDSTSLQNLIQIGPPSAEKNDVMSIFKMVDLSHLGF